MFQGSLKASATGSFEVLSSLKWGRLQDVGCRGFRVYGSGFGGFRAGASGCKGLGFMGLVISNYGLFLVLGGRGLRVKPVVKENSSGTDSKQHPVVNQVSVGMLINALSRSKESTAIHCLR